MLASSGPARVKNQTAREIRRFCNRGVDWLLFLGHLWVEQSNLKFEAPRGSTRRMNGVAVKLHCPVDGLKSESPDLADSAAERHDPHAAARYVIPARGVAIAFGIPVRGNDRPTGQVVALL